MATAANVRQPGTAAGLGACEREVRTATGSSFTLDELAEEVPVALVYNGISHAVMMATPLDLEDFAYGFSLTEGIIDTPEQILGIDVAPSALGVEVQIEVTGEVFLRLKHRRRQLTGRTGCGLCGLDSLAAVYPTVATVTAAPLPAFATVNAALASLQQQQQLQQLCGAVHAAAAVSASGKVTTLREDVGRHNALDKLIGSFRQQPNAANFVLVSSRASYEMVVKAAAADISTLVAVSAPTTMAVKLAQQANMNLIGFARPGRQVIYNRQT